jgi:hypothetical protein
MNSDRLIKILFLASAPSAEIQLHNIPEYLTSVIKNNLNSNKTNLKSLFSQDIPQLKNRLTIFTQPNMESNHKKCNLTKMQQLYLSSDLSF